MEQNVPEFLSAEVTQESHGKYQPGSEQSKQRWAGELRAFHDGNGLRHPKLARTFLLHGQYLWIGNGGQTGKAAHQANGADTDRSGEHEYAQSPESQESVGTGPR